VKKVANVLFVNPGSAFALPSTLRFFTNHMIIVNNVGFEEGFEVESFIVTTSVALLMASIQ
jgi:hypothetical protein